MAAPTIIYNYVSRDAKVALEEFRNDFEMAYQMDMAEQWASANGLTIQTKNLRVTLPVPISSAGYIERKGDRRYRRLSEKHFSFIPRVWQDGFAEYAEIVEAPDFIGFQAEPARMAAAASQLKNELVSALLESNPTIKDLEGNPWDNVAFFSASHPNNVLVPTGPTFSNDITGSNTLLNPTNVGRARQNFRKIKGPNGKPLGVRFKCLLVPPALEEAARVVKEQGLVAQGMSGTPGPSGGAFGAVENIYKGTDYIVSDQLTSDTVWYAIGEKVGMYPWAVIDRGSPETVVLDKTSALYEREDKVGLSSKLQTEAGLCFAQLMQRWAGNS